MEYLSKGQLDQAATQFGVALRNPSDSPLASFYLGVCYAAAGKDEQALAKLDEAVKRDPKNLAAYTLSGMIQARKGDTAIGVSQRRWLSFPTTSLPRGAIARLASL